MFNPSRIGEVVAGVFCITVGNVIFGTIGFGVGVDGVNRIFSSLNSVWTNHQTELHALKMWEQTALKPAVSN
jgi:hypothetical protein